MTPAEIEQAKHTATWCNQLATAGIATACLTPLMNYINVQPTDRISGIYLFAMIVLVIFFATIAHKIGESILGEIT
jgi:hypothetical protein